MKKEFKKDMLWMSAILFTGLFVADLIGGERYTELNQGIRNLIGGIIGALIGGFIYAYLNNRKNNENKK